MTELFARCDHEKERGRGRLANFTGDLYVYCVEPVCGPAGAAIRGAKKFKSPIDN